jgi:hypothetical protein
MTTAQAAQQTGGELNQRSGLSTIGVNVTGSPTPMDLKWTRWHSTERKLS